jgi:hypothetical protein
MEAEEQAGDASGDDGGGGAEDDAAFDSQAARVLWSTGQAEGGSSFVISTIVAAVGGGDMLGDVVLMKDFEDRRRQLQSMIPLRNISTHDPCIGRHTLTAKNHGEPFLELEIQALYFPLNLNKLQLRLLSLPNMATDEKKVYLASTTAPVNIAVIKYPPSPHFESPPACLNFLPFHLSPAATFLNCTLLY